jgi:archaeal flagellin FlaB
MLRKLFKQKRYFKNIYKSQKGITGLETAIILIAFVVVAAVFAYTVLSAGLFSTQKSQEAVYSGLEKTQSTLELKSSVVGIGVAGDNLTDLVFTLAIVTGSNGIDFTADPNNVVTISLSDKTQRVEELTWTKVAVGEDNSNDLLEPNEQFQITVDITGLGLGANDTFTIEIKTAKGAVMSFQRTLPGYINTNNDLH